MRKLFVRLGLAVTFFGLNAIATLNTTQAEVRLTTEIGVTNPVSNSFAIALYQPRSRSLQPTYQILAGRWKAVPASSTTVNVITKDYIFSLDGKITDCDPSSTIGQSKVIRYSIGDSITFYYDDGHTETGSFAFGTSNANATDMDSFRFSGNPRTGLLIFTRIKDPGLSNTSCGRGRRP